MNKKQLMNKIASTLIQSKADAERNFDSILAIMDLFTLTMNMNMMMTFSKGDV